MIIFSSNLHVDIMTLCCQMAGFICLEEVRGRKEEKDGTVNASFRPGSMLNFIYILRNSSSLKIMQSDFNLVVFLDSV